MDSQRLYQLTFELDHWIATNKQLAHEIDQKYAPRKRFEAWRDSSDGKAWKKQQYIKQQGGCAICGHCLSLKSAHIDHIKPLSAHPKLATNTSNLQLLCRECNLRKSAR